MVRTIRRIEGTIWSPRRNPSGVRIGPLELVVVVDHNPALLRRVCEQFPEARVVENTEPRGSSGAWNSGVMASRGRIIAFLDDDAEAEPDWLERLWKAYADDSVMGVGGSIRPVWEGAARPRWFPDEFLWVVGCTYRGLPEETAPVRNLIGCNMSFRRSAFEEIGGFRKGMGHVGGRPIGDDETEFSIRVGLRWPDRVLLHHPEARVRHKVPASRARWSYFYSRCRLEGRSQSVDERAGGHPPWAGGRVYVCFQNVAPWDVAWSGRCDMGRLDRPGTRLGHLFGTGDHNHPLCPGGGGIFLWRSYHRAHRAGVTPR